MTFPAGPWWNSCRQKQPFKIKGVQGNIPASARANRQHATKRDGCVVSAESSAFELIKTGNIPKVLLSKLTIPCEYIVFFIWLFLSKQIYGNSTDGHA